MWAHIYTQVVVERHTVVTVGDSLQVHTCIVVDDNRIHEVPNIYVIPDMYIVYVN